ncbi:unnamed protein product [Dicrocoelium dendriticum]|nr:unnamed protein product [Dicrocoelium dendriticum]
MGLFHLGFLVVYISPPLLSGFTCASAFHVLLSQLNGLFGIQMKSATGPGRLPYTVYNFFAAITTIHLVTILISTACILILVAFRFFLNPRIEAKIRFPFPVELIVLIIATVVSYFVQLEAKYNVRIVGPLPNGLPQPVLPDFTIVPEIFLEAVIVSLVAVTTTVSLVKLYATRFGYGVHYTQEMLALGMSNIFGGFLRCHTASAALARTSVSVNAGMQSQIASLISCVMLLLVLTVIGPVLQSVPMCVLSSLITVSLTGVFAQVMDIPKLYRISTFDLVGPSHTCPVFMTQPYHCLADC